MFPKIIRPLGYLPSSSNGAQVTHLTRKSFDVPDDPICHSPTFVNLTNYENLIHYQQYYSYNFNQNANRKMYLSEMCIKYYAT